MSRKRNYDKPKDSGLTVYAHNHPNVETLLRKFKKRIQASGVIEEYKNRQYYVKKSVQKRLKNKAAAYNAKKSSKNT